MRPAREAIWRDDSAACSMMSALDILATSAIGGERSVGPEDRSSGYCNVSGRFRKPRSDCTGL